MQPIPVSITAAPRDPVIHRRCFQNVDRAGFRDVTIFAEPGMRTAGIDIPHGWTISGNLERLGQWRNFLFALEYQLLRGSSARLCTIEDDVVFCRNVAELLALDPWPSERCGCLQVYTPAHYAAHPRGLSVLPPEEALDLLGACALVFSRAAADCLVDWGKSKGWRGHADVVIEEPEKKEAADTYVGEVLTVEGFEIWVRNPSLAQHIGDESTLGHPGTTARRTALDWPGEDADAMEIFRCG